MPHVSRGSRTSCGVPLCSPPVDAPRFETVDAPSRLPAALRRGRTHRAKPSYSLEAPTSRSEPGVRASSRSCSGRVMSPSPGISPSFVGSGSRSGLRGPPLPGRHLDASGERHIATRSSFGHVDLVLKRGPDEWHTGLCGLRIARGHQRVSPALPAPTMSQGSHGRRRRPAPEAGCCVIVSADLRRRLAGA
jgi:hypothetical protein